MTAFTANRTASLGLALLLTGATYGQLSVEFQQVAGSGDSVSNVAGGSIDELPFEFPSVDAGGNTAFYAFVDPNNSGLVTEVNGSLNLIAPFWGISPTGNPYYQPRNYRMENGTVSWTNGEAIFSAPADGSGSVSMLLQQGDTCPDANGNLIPTDTYIQFRNYAADGIGFTFTASLSVGEGAEGLYQYGTAGGRELLRSGMPSPFGDGSAVSRFFEVDAGNGNWVAGVVTSNQTAGFVGDFGNGVEVIASTLTPSPSGLGNFTGFNNACVDGNRVVFEGFTSNSGIYEWDATTGNLRTIADSSMTTPSGVAFENAYQPSAANGITVFTAYSNPGGMFLEQDGVMTEILNDGDMIDGMTVQGWNVQRSHGMEGDQLAIFIFFEGSIPTQNGPAFIYTATISEACPGDANGDGTVDLSDLAEVLSQFGRSNGSLSGDLNLDGTVDLSDLAIVLAEFGRSCS